MDLPNKSSLIRAVAHNPLCRNAEVLFTGSPPFMLFFAIALKVLCNVRLIYRITDFYPEVIIAERGGSSFVLRMLERFTWFIRRRVIRSRHSEKMSGIF